ncbi:MAG: hypothetical protein HUJ92_09045, partial [Bacteroidales bacterium]|nr:hypothetical protein [Bacteroidales bacterium]
DVTLLDGQPKPLAAGHYMDNVNNIYPEFTYFTDDFDCAVVSIAEMSQRLFMRNGTKNDWYCLCLNEYALGWDAEHPIFKGPFEVKIVPEDRPTPETAREYPGGTDLPETTPMFQVHEKGSRVGMVSRPWGYLDSPETEIISGGESSKSIDAVAISRHANMFHWGFVGNPEKMTPAGRNLFANAIVYAAKFKGQKPIARKLNERVATSYDVKQQMSYYTEDFYNMYKSAQENAWKAILKMKEEIKAKKDAGETLTRDDEMILNMPPYNVISREQFVQRMLPAQFALYGTDYERYAEYFAGNDGYYFDDRAQGNVVVDEDAKALGIKVGDIRLIEKAIELLGDKSSAEMGQRILNRYTLRKFRTQEEWKEWFASNKNKIFFSESGGWVYLVNTTEEGENDYRNWRNYFTLNVESLKIAEATSSQNPVSFSAEAQTLLQGEIRLVLKAHIQPTYHIYGYVSKDEPFIATKVEFVLPENCHKIGDVKASDGQPMGTTGTVIYENEAEYSQIFYASEPVKVECKVSYQCCNESICFQPKDETFTFTVNPYKGNGNN